MCVWLKNYVTFSIHGAFCCVNEVAGVHGYSANILVVLQQRQFKAKHEVSILVPYLVRRNTFYMITAAWPQNTNKIPLILRQG